jgi:AraC family transcriptional regulator, regulatory protein of adaptative response / methylated-DNA-[protein]-cysteine methyltransferase
VQSGRRLADAQSAALVARACRPIEQSEEAIPLERLAREVGLSASYFHRLFKATTSLMPKDFATAHRANRVREGLANGRSVTDAIYDAGFNSAAASARSRPQCSA